jgi:hypothetical protein
MSDPGPAQLDLIRRYARTLREMHADAMRGRPQVAGRDDRAVGVRPASDPIRQAAKAMTTRAASEVTRSGAPTLPAS